MTCHDSYPAEEFERRPRRQVVVGVDGSVASLSALRWAHEQVQMTGGDLTAVWVYPPPVTVDYGSGPFPAVNAVDPDRVRAMTLSALGDVVRGVVGDDVRAVRCLAEEDGSAAAALLRHAEGAAMLVVGATHVQAFGLRLGSTAGSCMRHATCPVVVVPPALGSTAGAVPAPREGERGRVRS